VADMEFEENYKQSFFLFAVDKTDLDAYKLPLSLVFANLYKSQKQHPLVPFD
jgi:fructose 1,6-bisphosphatase